MIKFFKKIVVILGMVYLTFISIKEMVNVLDLYIDSPSYNAKAFLNDFNNAICKNINILQNAYKEGLGI
jgi:hypothetical protein